MYTRPQRRRPDTDHGARPQEKLYSRVRRRKKIRSETAGQFRFCSVFALREGLQPDQPGQWSGIGSEATLPYAIFEYFFIDKFEYASMAGDLEHSRYVMICWHDDEHYDLSRSNLPCPEFPDCQTFQQVHIKLAHDRLFKPDRMWFTPPSTPRPFDMFRKPTTGSVMMPSAAKPNLGSMDTEYNHG